MKNAQAKIDALLDLLVDRLEQELAAQSTGPTEEQLGELEKLIKLSNLNRGRAEKVGKLSGELSQSKTPEMTNEELVEALKAARPKDLFPRRGPPNGKRENVSTPEPPESEPA